MVPWQHAQMNTKHQSTWRIAIGDLFAPTRKSWPDGSFELRYFDGNFLLQLCEPHPSSELLHAFRYGAMHIALYAEQGVIFFLFRIEGAWGWSDQPFSVRLVHEEDQGPGDPIGNHYVLLSVVLVNSRTGRVCALRQVTMSPTFAQAFHKLIENQRTAPFSMEAHCQAIKSVYSTLPTSDIMAAAALHVERAGQSTA